MNVNEKEVRRIRLEGKIMEIREKEDLQQFWKEQSNLTIPRLVKDEINVDSIVNVLSKEASENQTVDVDLLARSFTLSKKPKEAIHAINDVIDSLNRKKARVIEKVLREQVDEYSLEKGVASVLSRDHGKTCVRISREDVRKAEEVLRKEGKVVSIKTVENYLYETLPHVPYLSKTERQRLGLV